MKNRRVTLADGQTVVINDNEWFAVVNKKEFNETETEILRITRHQSGLLHRIYVMRSVLLNKGHGDQSDTPERRETVERNIITPVQDLAQETAAAMTACGLRLIAG